MAFDVKVKELQGGIIFVMPEGRLDADTHGFLREKITPYLSEFTKTLIFDMKNLDYISSSGLGVIFQARKAIDQKGGRFIMTNLQPQIKKVFEIVSAWPGDPVYKTQEEVDAYLDSVQKEEIEKQKE